MSLAWRKNHFSAGGNESDCPPKAGGKVDATSTCPPSTEGQGLIAGSSAATALSSPPGPSDAREGLLSRSFIGLLVTQFLGAMNDNMFRWLIVPIGKELAGEAAAPTVVAVGAVMLVLPFVLLAAPAGYLADRFSKQKVIVGCKVGEIAAMLLAVAAILLGNVYVMFVVLFFMGAQSALFSPSKYGSIPELVRPDRISAANGMIGMTTILAIVLGSIAGGYLYHWTAPAGRTHWWLWAGAIVGVAVVGWFTSLLIRPLAPANPAKRFPWDIAGETLQNCRLLWSARPLLLAALGSALFWSLGGLCQINADRLATVDLGVGQKDVGPLLGLLALGVGLGNVLAGVLSAGRIELGMVPIGAAGIALSSSLLWTVPDGNGELSSAGYLLGGLWLFTLGLSAGMYDVPLQSFLQYRSPEKCRGAILAASSFLTFTGMILASGIFIVLSGPLGLSGREIFLVSGLTVVPVLFTALYLLIPQTVRFVARLALQLVYRLRVEGLEHLPREGGGLLVVNHMGWIGRLLLAGACPRDIRMILPAEQLDQSGWGCQRGLGWLMRAIPLRMNNITAEDAPSTLPTLRQLLADGELLAVFCEDQLGPNGQPASPPDRHLANVLAVLRDAAVPLVPGFLGSVEKGILSIFANRSDTDSLNFAACSGLLVMRRSKSSTVGQRGGRFCWRLRRRRVVIRFGPPLYAFDTAEEVVAAVMALANKTTDKTAATKMDE